MTDDSTKINQFFDRCAAALLDHDAATPAELYAVPSLILFPPTSIAATDAGHGDPSPSRSSET